MLLVLGLALGAVSVVLALTWPGFRVRRIEVSGQRVVTRDDVRAAAAISPEANLWLLDARATARRIEAIPYVRDVSVRRVPPAELDIAITERSPYAILVDGTTRVLVDRDLRVLGEGNAALALPRMEVPHASIGAVGSFVDDATVVALRGDAETLAAAHLPARDLALDAYGSLTATIAGGVRVLLGDDENLAKKISLIEPILAKFSRGARHVAIVDLRAPSAPVVTFGTR